MLRVQQICIVDSPADGTIYPTRPVWYRVQTGAAFPASGRVCLALRGLSCSGTACAAACRVQTVRARWGHPGGIGPEARVGAVSLVSSDQNKKGTFFANTHPTFTKRNLSDCASLQIFRKIQKGPSRSLDCAIIN